MNERDRGMGCQTGRVFTLWVAAILLGVTLALLWVGYAGAAARVREQGSYALGIGPHPSGLALVSDDGMATWRNP